MKFRIQRETLLKPLQAVIGVVERRQTLPVLSNILVQAGDNHITLTSTDLEVELLATFNVDVAEPGIITIPARKLVDICRTLPDESVLDIQLKGEKITLKSGRSRFTLATLAASEFPQIDEIHAQSSFEITEREFKRLIEKTHFSMAQQDVRYYLNGLMFELNPDSLRTVATDGHRLAMCQHTMKIDIDGSNQVIVPRKGIQELNRLLEDSDKTVKVMISNNHIRVEMDNLRFTSKLIDGKFPDYNRVIPSNSDKLIMLDLETIKKSLVRTSILSNEKYRGVRLTFDKNVLSIQAHNPEQEEAEDELAIDYDDQTIEIGFNVTYILEALGVIDTEQVILALTDANSSCLIYSQDNKDCQYVIMPMRL